MTQDTKYTQIVDDKTGEIKYVPESPPTPPPSPPGKGNGNAEKDEERQRMEERIRDDVEQENEELLDEGMGEKLLKADSYERVKRILEGIRANNKRLRYNKRLTRGKLDSSRLYTVATSRPEDLRLYKQKAIRDREYQFTFLVDTSGSMFDQGGNDNGDSRIKVAMESIIQSASALESIGYKTAVVAMNLSLSLVKRFDEEFDANKVFNATMDNMMSASKRYEGNETEGSPSCAGTNEKVGYNLTLDYIAKHTPPKTENVLMIFSDGEPNTEGDIVRVDGFDGPEERYIPNEHANYNELREILERQKLAKVFGFGIQSSAQQVPNSRRIDTTADLPKAVSDMVQKVIN